ncbi:MAG: hypothetical protein ACXU86_19355 [Archangium sp.]
MARRNWRPVLAAAAVLLLVLPTSLAPIAEHSEPETSGEAWPTNLDLDPAPVRPGEAPRPARNQKRAPCNPRVEVEVAGVCWVPHATKPPCPPELTEYAGQCLLPVAKAQRPPTSLDAGEPG